MDSNINASKRDTAPELEFIIIKLSVEKLEDTLNVPWEDSDSDVANISKEDSDSAKIINSENIVADISEDIDVSIEDIRANLDSVNTQFKNVSEDILESKKYVKVKNVNSSKDGEEFADIDTEKDAGEEEEFANLDVGENVDGLMYLEEFAEPEEEEDAEFSTELLKDVILNIKEDASEEDYSDLKDTDAIEEPSVKNVDSVSENVIEEKSGAEDIEDVDSVNKEDSALDSHSEDASERDYADIEDIKEKK